MMTPALLGVDIGTTSTKAALFDAHGRELARASSSPYHLHTPQPGWIEQDPEELWQALLSVLQTIAQKTPTGTSIRALCLACQSGSLIPADEAGQPVYPMISWMDGRTAALVKEWRASGIGEWVKPISGWSLYPGLCLPTIAWLKQNSPQVFASAAHYFSANDFLIYRLTGRRVTNPSNAGGMQLVDLRTGRWNDRLCGLAGIPSGNLSEIQASGSVIGTLCKQAAQITGLSEDLLVVNGGHDQGCTALGLGITQPGKILLACGTAWVFTGVLTEVSPHDLPPQLDRNFHAIPDRWTLSQSLGGLGASVEWWVTRAADPQVSRVEQYKTFDREIESARFGESCFFIPLSGGHDDPATTRCGAFAGLRLDHTRSEMGRSILESAGYELRWAFDQVRAGGQPIEEVWMVGGAARSPHWPAILADITQATIQLPQYDNWPAAGAAVLAGLGTGLFTSPEAGAARFHQTGQSIPPAPDRSARYQELFETYQHYVRKLTALSTDEP